MKLENLGLNQTVLTFQNGTKILFSYNTPVAAYVVQQGFVKTKTNHSVTTTKHIQKWLNGCYATPVSQDYLNNLLSTQ